MRFSEVSRKKIVRVAAKMLGPARKMGQSESFIRHGRILRLCYLSPRLPSPALQPHLPVAVTASWKLSPYLIWPFTTAIQITSRYITPDPRHQSRFHEIHSI